MWVPLNSSSVPTRPSNMAWASCERVLEHLEPLTEGREGEPQASRLLLVPGGTEAEPCTSAGEHVERGRRLHPQARRTVVDPTDHQAKACPLRERREVAERGPALQHRLLGAADDPDLEEVVHHPDGVEPGIVGLAGNAGEGGADGGSPPGHVNELICRPTFIAGA